MLPFASIKRKRRVRKNVAVAAAKPMVHILPHSSIHPSIGCLSTSPASNFPTPIEGAIDRSIEITSSIEETTLAAFG
jgi:hypothetical protein